MSHYLILLALIPVSCFSLATLFRCTYKNTIKGFSLGLVVAPVSFACVTFTFVPIIGKLIGFLGLPIHIVHFWFGYLLMIGMNVVEPGAPLTTLQFAMLHILNAMFFAPLYALIGYALDVRRQDMPFTRVIFRKLIL